MNRCRPISTFTYHERFAIFALSLLVSLPPLSPSLYKPNTISTFISLFVPTVHLETFCLHQQEACGVELKIFLCSSVCSEDLSQLGQRISELCLEIIWINSFFPVPMTLILQL